MSWAAVIVGGASLIGGYMNSRSAGDAADSQVDASREANALQKYIYDQNRADLYPYRETGRNALNALNRVMGLPQVGMDEPQSVSQHPLYGDGNTPLTREGLMQAYRDVLGREADDSGVNYYLTGGPKVDGRAAGVAHINPVLGRASQHIGERSALLGALGFGGDDGTRRSYTFNEFLNATLGSDEYKQKVADGTIQAWDASRLRPQEGQEFLGGSQTNPDDRYGGFYESPGYQFAHDQAMLGAERAASAGGYLPTSDGGQSGRFSKEMARYSQGLASQEFANYYNRLAGLAGTGQTATTTTAQLGQNYAGMAGSNLIRAGDARASGIIGQSNAWGDTVGNLGTLAAWKIGGRT